MKKSTKNFLILLLIGIIGIGIYYSYDSKKNDDNSIVIPGNKSSQSEESNSATFPKKYKRLEDLSTLEDGDKILIVSKFDNLFISYPTNFTTNPYSTVEVDETGQYIESWIEESVWTVYTSSSTYALYSELDKKYLSGKTSTTELILKESISEATYFSLFKDEKANMYFGLEDVESTIRRGIFYRGSTNLGFRHYITSNIGSTSYATETSVFIFS